MLKMLNEEDNEQESWLTAFWKGTFDFANTRRIFWELYCRGPQESFILSSCPIDFRRRFLSLLSYQFSKFSPSLALNILQNKNIQQQPQPREYPGSQCSGRLQCMWMFIGALEYMPYVMSLVECRGLRLVSDCVLFLLSRKTLVFLSKS